MKVRYLASKLRERGFLWSLKKLRQYFLRAVSYVLLLPFAILLRLALLLLKPVLHVRFGQLVSHRLGTFATFTELSLCERDAEIPPARSLDLWYHYDEYAYMLRKKVKPKDAISNQQLNKMWERVIRITEIARPLAYLNLMLAPGSATFMVNNNHRDSHDVNGLLSRFPPHLTFTPEEEKLGREHLREMGIGPDDSFVCIHARDSAYLDIARPRNVEVHGDWDWQDLRDSTIENYLLAAEKLADLGYFVIRMGKHVKGAFESDNPRIIDYATRCQSDFMDIFLSARCAFFIGQSSGMISVPMIFRRPTLYVNVFPLWDVSYCQYAPGMMIPKKYYSRVQERFLPFREVFDLGLGITNIKLPEHQELFQKLGLEILENTPEEICDAALEMHSRLNTDFTQSSEEQQLQARFLSVMRSHPDGILENSKAPDPVASSHFLRTNPELLA